MKFARFFIDRPIFAAVLSIIVFLVGAIAVWQLPISQYPEVVPPSVQVRAQYPGANPKVIAETVAAPLEQEINGVENMLYMSSQATSDGTMLLTITFRLGTDVDNAQVEVQNRVAQALPRLPEDVRRVGVTTKKASPDLLMVVHLIRPVTATTRCICATTPRSRCATCSRACRAWVKFACSVQATIRCAYGWIRSASRAAA